MIIRLCPKLSGTNWHIYTPVDATITSVSFILLESTIGYVFLIPENLSSGDKKVTVWRIRYCVRWKVTL